MSQSIEVALLVVNGCLVNGRPLKAGVILHVSPAEAVRLLCPHAIELLNQTDHELVRQEVHRQALRIPLAQRTWARP